VRSAAGVDEERGDVVEVVGARFVLPEAPAAEAPPLVTREELWRAGEILGLLLAILLALQLGVRPLLRRLAAAPAPPPAAEPLLTSVAGPAVTTTALPPATAEPGQGEALLAAPGGVAGAGPAAERMVSLKQFAGEIRASLISEVAEFVASHPEDSARVVRSWLHGG
jgi:flagellar biosynthesis/type III secretory pathway M-ring protein FliF/YscJ